MNKLSMESRSRLYSFIMMTSSNRKISALLALLCGEFTGHLWISLTKAGDAEFAGYFDLSPNRRLSKGSIGRWFETPSRSLLRHCDDKRPARKSGWANLLVFSVPGGPAFVFITNATSSRDWTTGLGLSTVL